MSGIKITELPASTTPLSGTEVVPLVQNGVTKRATVTQIGTVTATGTTTPRTLPDRFADVINVKDFGAVGDGVTDDTAAIQAAVDYSQSIDYGVGEGGIRPTIYFPAGAYLTGTITANKRMCILGSGSASTLIRLKSGVSTSLFVFNAENTTGTSLDDAANYELCGMTLAGNRVDGVTTGASHGVECPATAWSMATQYSPSTRASDLIVQGFTGNGIYLGTNRNWALFDRCIIRYNNDCGLVTLGYDGRFTACDFGVNKNYGVRELAGGANVFSGCNVYFNTINVVCDPFTNAYSTFVGCSFDGALQEGAVISSGAAKKKFIGSRFSGNSRSGANSYSDIKTAAAIQVLGCEFSYSGQKVKLLLETNGTAQPVVWAGNLYDTATTPYQTAITDDATVLNYAGSNDARWGSAGDGTLAAYSGSAEVFKIGSANTEHRVPALLKSYVKASLPSPSANTAGLIYVTDDVGGATPAFSDGSNWRRVSDRAIIA